MKKVLMGLAATSLIFAGCSKNELTDVNSANPDLIGFDMNTGKTKASDNKLSSLEGDAGGIKIFATNTGASTQFIDNKVYKFDNGNWIWESGDIQWPSTEEEYPINFYAYYPANSVPKLTTILTWEYMIPSTSAEQVDYLVANNLNIITRPASSKVDLNFKHILSKVNFSVYAGNATTVMVQSIGIKKVANKKMFNFSDLTWEEQNWANQGSYVYTSYEKTTENTFIGSSTTAVTTIGGSLMLMPQSITAWMNPGVATWNEASLEKGAYIESIYRIVETPANNGKDVIGFDDATKHPLYGTLGGKVTGALFVKVAYPLDGTWTMGKAYNYVINLGNPDSSGGILIDNNFYDENGVRTDLPVITPDGYDKQPGEPIFNTGSTIGFTVKVGEWEEVVTPPVK